ncbi:unnamed protein product [Microthlaspi erraticum]|uniref:Uncharacterized protein n=1 Tax=Microthlaspi erraticum TaxID=1685480 RepID=A0A6D2ISY2_9BRAS|nr:unnamed protein product [Microthlaspi erraticum]
MVFPVKKMTSAISSVFSRKKTLAGEKSDHQGDNSAEADESLSVGQRLKTRKRKRRRRKNLSEGSGEEELCKKRILMGERCKPINRSGILQYAGDGILLPEA